MNPRLRGWTAGILLFAFLRSPSIAGASSGALPIHFRNQPIEVQEGDELAFVAASAGNGFHDEAEAEMPSPHFGYQVHAWLRDIPPSSTGWLEAAGKLFGMNTFASSVPAFSYRSGVGLRGDSAVAPNAAHFSLAQNSPLTQTTTPDTIPQIEYPPKLDLPGTVPLIPALPSADTSVPKPSRSPLLEPEEPLPSAEEGASNRARSQTQMLMEETRTVINPVQRTALNQALSTGETFLDGIGRVPGTLASPFLTGPGSQRLGFHIGPLNYNPYVGVTINGVRENGGADSHRSGALVTLLGGINALLGDSSRQFYGTLNYQAGFNLVTLEGDRSRVDQDLSMMLHLAPRNLDKMQFALGVTFDGLSGLNRDTGTNTERDLLTLSLASSFAYSPKLSFDWDLTMPIREFQGAISSSGITSTNLINYDYSVKTRIGLGVTIGTLRVEQASNQTFEQPIIRLDFKPSPILSFDATLGYEFRQVGRQEMNTPIFGVGATWTPRLGTSVSLAGERRSFNSADVANTNYTSTSLMLTLNQRIGPWITGVITLGYETAQYASVGDNGDGSRHDELLEGQIGFIYSVTDRWKWSLSFTGDKNQSNQRPIEDIQVALQTTFVF